MSEINFLEIYLIFIGITTVLYSLSVYRRDYKSKNSKMNIIPFFSKRLISYALISVVFISLFNLIPLNYRSIELVKKVNTFAEDVLGIPNFGDNFSNEISNQLGGDNTESDNIQFLLQNDNDNNLYLKCEVYDTYTGKSFEKSTALENSLYTDIYDRQIFSIANPAIFTQEYLSITMVDYNSNVLPVPNYFSYVGSELLDTEENFLTSSQGEVFYDKYFTDEEILISYYNFEEKAIYDYGPETEQADFYSLPSTVTDRTINLAKTFTVDDSLTNEQIATNMCVYLYQNYNYTLTPNEVKGYDFVDSFLFEHQEGYCTSFASALFVMLRAVDIPCLYVVGYTPPGNETADLYGYVEVLEKNLHSWVEVYIEGQGFVIFDPLSFSGYIQDANVADDLAENPSATSEPEATDEPEPSISPEATEIPKTSEESIENDEKLETGFNDYFIIILAVISLLLISALTYFIIKKRNNYIA
ncbi:MAG: transglutaminase-like domain-containing protein, partial [Clostridia bacterium]